MSQLKAMNDAYQKLKLYPDDFFRFHCSSGIPCFTNCCQDINIFLTSYDVLHRKRGLHISSDEFLEKYTIIIPKKIHLIPLVLIKMKEDDKKCPFVSPEGCNVFENRPWPCRMHPLDINDERTFTLIINPSRCQGLSQTEGLGIGEWLVEQGIVPYDEMNRLFSEITIPLGVHEIKIDNPNVVKMTFMALYNLDKFKDFLLKSTFMERLDIDHKKIYKITRDDLELIKFAFDLIHLGTFGKKVFTLKRTINS
jgi:uncharacterized protein